MLAGVEVLADGAPAAGIDSCGDVIVVDIGGATTDVYSVITPLGEDATLAKDVVAQLWRARTVEGDLGMRWGATGVVEAAIAEHLGSASFQWTEHAHRVRADIGWLPATAADRMAETRVAAMAALIAMRRHARPATATSGPRPLREVGAVIGSGGVLRHGDDDLRRAVLEPLTTDHGGGWRVPERAELMVDDRYVLFAAGLLAPSAPIAAAALAVTGLSRVPRRP